MQLPQTENHAGGKIPAAGVIDAKNSYVIGDRETDIQLAENMGITGLRYGQPDTDWNSIAEQLTRRDRYSRVGAEPKRPIFSPKYGSTAKAAAPSAPVSAFRSHAGSDCHPRRFPPQYSGQRRPVIDDHHSVEDTGLALGEALKLALGDKRGITRFGFTLPMDECLARCALDISGRPHGIQS